VGTVNNDDLFAPEVVANPYPYFDGLRREDPVHWNEKYELWVISRYDHLEWVTGHHDLFSSQFLKRDRRPPYPPVPESEMALFEMVRDYQSKWMLQQDRPEHLEQRMVLHEHFTPKAVESWRNPVRSAVKELLDVAEEKGRVDLMRDFAVPLPLLVISQMMGIPVHDRPYVRSLAEKLLFTGRPDADRFHNILLGIKGMYEYLAPLAEERMANPGDDLLSVLVDGERRGVFTREEVLADGTLLLLGGHETTIHLICNGTLALLSHDNQWELLREDPEGRAYWATEECLRYDAPVKSVIRIAVQDVELAGKLIRKDDRVRAFISSANRDPLKFRDANEFDISRHPNPHVAFSSGIHHCLGANLARLEGQEVFKALALRFPKMRLESDRLEYEPSINFRALKRLPVSLN